MMDISGEHLYSLAALFSMAAYFMTNMLWLRILLVAASSLYVLSGIGLEVSSMIGWNGVYILINVFHVVLLLVDKCKISLPSTVRGIYTGSFSELSTRQFKKLISINEAQTPNEKFVIKEGEETGRLLVLLEGNARVLKSGALIAQLQAGDFIGEMSFISKKPASASVELEKNAVYAYWTHADLKKLQLKHNDIYTKFISIIGSDLVRKINVGNEKLNESLI